MTASLSHPLKSDKCGQVKLYRSIFSIQDKESVSKDTLIMSIPLYLYFLCISIRFYISIRLEGDIDAQKPTIKNFPRPAYSDKDFLLP